MRCQNKDSTSTKGIAEHLIDKRIAKPLYEEIFKKSGDESVRMILDVINNKEIDTDFLLGEKYAGSSNVQIFKMKDKFGKELNSLFRMIKIKNNITEEYELNGMKIQMDLFGGEFINKIYQYGYYTIRNPEVEPINCKKCTEINLYNIIEPCYGGDFLDIYNDYGDYYFKYPVIFYNFTINLLKGLNYIHSKNYVHMDIKPENIGLKEKINIRKIETFYNLRILDFGLSLKFGEYGPRGSPFYAAPEIQFNSNPKFNKPLYGKSDVFSVGRIIYLLIFGIKNTSPVKNKNEDYKIYLDQMPEYLKKDSVNFGNFIKGLTNYNVQERFTASQALNHPFLRESGYL